MIDDELIRAAAAHYHLLTKEMLRASSVSDERWARLLDREIWIPVTPVHHRHAATPLTLEMQIVAGAEWLGSRGALHGTTALWWLGVDVAPPSAASFVVPRGCRSIAPWMALHTTTAWDSGQVVLHRGVRTTTASRALIDLAGRSPSARSLEDAIDASVHARRTSLPTIRRVLASMPTNGRPGVRLLREVLLDSGGESFLERRFLRLAREHGLPAPRCQVILRSDGGTARVDFLFGDDVVVEVSGRLGHVTDRERQKDARRRNALQQRGMTVLEFTTADVIDDPQHVLATLARSQVVTNRPKLLPVET